MTKTSTYVKICLVFQSSILLVDIIFWRKQRRTSTPLEFDDQGILVKNMSESFFSCFDLKSWYIKYLKTVTRPSTEALPNAWDKKQRPQLGILYVVQGTCAAFQISTVLGARTKTSLTEIECCYSSELSRISLNLVATAEQHFHTKLMQGSISQRLVHILSTRHCCRWLVLKTWSTLTDRVLKVRIRGKLNKVIGHQVLQ